MSFSSRSPYCCTALIPLSISIFFLSPFNAALPPHSPQAATFPDGWINGGRRWIEEVGGNSPLPLAENRAYRRDPTDNFKLYDGGWNISDQHYWASVGFTAAPCFVLAAAWFVIFGLILLGMYLYTCCCKKKAPYGYSRMCYACSLIFLIIFTIAAIIGSVFLYTGQGKFNLSTGNTLDYVVGQADATAMNLTFVSSYLDSAKRIGVFQLTLPENVQNEISNIQGKIDLSATTLSAVAQENSKKIQKVLNIVRTALVVVAAVMLLLAFMGFLFSICGLECLVYTMVVLGWLLVTVTFILCGVFLLLHNVVADTCVAMDEWVAHPTAHTALDDILPCVDNATAQEINQRSKDINHQLVSLIDAAILNVSNAHFLPNVAPLYYNQSGPLLPPLCNPYNADLTVRACAPGEVTFSNAIEEWKKYVCQVNGESNVCSTRGRLTPSYYEQLINAANVSDGLYTYGPFLVDLADCTFVRNTFSEIGQAHCPGLQEFSRWIYVGLVMVSASVMLSLIFWVIYARERRHRGYTKRMIRTQGGEGGARG